MGTAKIGLRRLLAIAAMVCMVVGCGNVGNAHHDTVEHSAGDDNLVVEATDRLDQPCISPQQQMGRPYSRPWHAGEPADTNELKLVDLSTCFVAYPLSDSLLLTMRGKSWPEGCPVDPSTLRYVRILHHNGSGLPQMGELIVHQQIARKVVEAFMELYAQHYPIERMVLVDHYDGSDERSMTDNNTSAFNFRYMTGSTTKISKHGLGLAIDINPLYNPYVKRRADGSLYVEPEAGRPYATGRGASSTSVLTVPLIDTDDLAYQVFTRLGFTWGGAWQSCQDYQHFEYDLED